MSSIAIPSVTQAISAATATGVLTVISSTNILPGAIGWVYKADGSASSLVRVTAQLSSTTVQVRAYANNTINNAPSYGFTDMTAYNGSSFISLDPQAVQVDFSYTPTQLP